MAFRSREPPPRSRAPAPTTIHDLGEDLILEIFLRLPSLPSLVRAAFACRAFLAAVRSSPAFRRRFRALHGPPVLGVFLGQDVTDVRSYVPLRRQSDPGFSAAARGSDFFVNRVPDFLAGARWHVVACRGGFVLLFDWITRRIAAYNPLTGALDLFPAPPAGGGELACHGYHMVPCDCDEAPGSFRVVSLFRDGSQLRAAIFSSATRAWQILPWTGEAPAQQLVRRHKLLTGPQRT
nr:unnamed protein product [Digitaria exilis]